MIGRGFPARQRDIVISFDDIPAATVPISDTTGTFTTSLIVPRSASGIHFFGHSFPGVTGGSETIFQVTPVISLNQTYGPPGAEITVSGDGFAANENAIIVNLDETPVATGEYAGSNGSWSTSFPLPSLLAGPHQVRASGSMTPRGNVPAITFTSIAPTGR